MTRVRTDFRRPEFVSLEKAAPRRDGSAAERFVRLMAREEAQRAERAAPPRDAREHLEGLVDADDVELERLNEARAARRAGAARRDVSGDAAAQGGRACERPPEALLQLLQHLADLADDEAMVPYGEWYATLNIDRPPITGTTLDVTLSPLRLLLRFSVQDADVGRLLLSHGPLLSRSLEHLFDARGTPRSVSWQVT